MNPLEKVLNFFSSSEAKSAQTASFNLQVGNFDGFFNPRNQTYNDSVEISKNPQLDLQILDNLHDTSHQPSQIETDIQQEI